MKNLLAATTMLCLFLSVQICAQEVNTKWKKVGKKDFNINVEDEYPDASAVVLFDIGSAEFDLNAGGYTALAYDVHRRIKILSKEGYEYANVQIPFDYINNDDVSNIQGYTYNMINGKIVEEKLKYSEIHEEDINEYRHQMKFSLPNVKVGSVIEYRYTIYARDFIGIKDWFFQKDIPVLYSQYTTRMPEDFIYTTHFQGMEQIDSKKVDSYLKFLGSTSRNIPIIKTEYIMKDIPPLKDIPHVATLRDYSARLRFQLQWLVIPGWYKKEYMNTWEKLIKEVLKSDYLGLQLKRNNSLKKQVSEIVAGIDNPKERMIRIYDYVSKTMKWNGSHRILSYEKLNKAFEEKSGHSGEINLMLTLMLREAGLESHPVLISTRSHGKILRTYPMFSQFNHLINYTEINDTIYLMNATNYDRPYKLLDKQDLNGQGLVIIEDNPTWVELINPVINSQKTSLIAAFNDEMDLTCTVNRSNSGYYAFDKSTEYKEDSEQYLNDYYIKSANDFRLDTFHLVQSEDFITTEHIRFTTGDFTNRTGDMLYLSPMLNFALEDNPFKREEREIPVDFNYTYDETFILNMTVPPGYEIVEKPESIKLILPNQGGEFLYYLTQNGNMIQLLSNIQINKTFFLAEEYPYLKQLFDGIVAKEAEPIVFRKKTN